MSNLLISIKSKFANKIFNGTKKFEFRRKSIGENNCNKKIYVYSSEQDKAIIGYIIVDEILKGNFEELMQMTENKITEDIESYFNGCNECYALHIKEYRRFDKIIKLEEIKKIDSKFVVPQFYRYIKDDEILNKYLEY